jgi:hypothetical protein
MAAEVGTPKRRGNWPEDVDLRGKSTLAIRRIEEGLTIQVKRYGLLDRSNVRLGYSSIRTIDLAETVAAYKLSQFLTWKSHLNRTHDMPLLLSHRKSTSRVAEPVSLCPL